MPEFKAKRFVNHNNICNYSNNNGSRVESCDDMVQLSSCLVGLHPDECTEDILDAALKHKKSVAIVPCCVFPSLFPKRKFLCSHVDSCNSSNNTCYKPVKTYNDFLCYLMEKDDRLCRETLPFEGRNQVIYLCQQQK